MIELFNKYLKEHLYKVGLANFVFFLLLAIAYQPKLRSNFQNVFTANASETPETVQTQQLTHTWLKNALTLNDYIQSQNFKTDSPKNRYDKFNSFSQTNNSLMNEVLQNQHTKNNTKLYNYYAELSHDFSAYFDIQKGNITNNSYTNNSADKATTALEKIKTKLSANIHSESNASKFDIQSLFIIISLLSLLTSLIHLIVRVKNLTTISSVTASQLDTFKKVISNMSEGVIVTDKYGQFSFCNEAAKKIIGYNINDIFYKSSIDLLGFYNADGTTMLKEQMPMYTALKKTILQDQEIYIKNTQNPDGIFVSASNGYFIDNKGSTAGSVVVLKNITTKKQLEQYWKNEKDRAIEASKLKSDFLASMSHEIRTPMNGIIGLTTLLSETHLNSEQYDYTKTIQRSAKSLLTLINDILDHSKIEAGKLDIVKNVFDLQELINDINDNFKPIVNEKNIELKLNLENLMHTHIESDSQRIRQILINLINNAIKFTHKGYVEITVLEIPDYQNKHTALTFKVTDTGVGMTPVERDHLFQKYFQTENGKNAGGTGLGLNICRQLVQLLEGEIGVTSRINEGSEFWFTIPVKFCSNIKQDAQPPSTNKVKSTSDFNVNFKGQILVAEDNLVNQKVISTYLTKMGFTVLIAQNGLEAIEMYKNNEPDLIFMDSNMPKLSGYDSTVAIIKLQNAGHKKCSIIGLSADVTEKNKILNLEAGMSDFLTKPIDLTHLVEVLHKHFTPLKTSKSTIDFSAADFSAADSSATDYTNADHLTNQNTFISQINKIKDLLIGDELLIDVLFNEFKAQAPIAVENIKNAYHTNDFQTLHNTAHSLKSAAAELDAVELKNVLQIIEDIAEKKCASINADDTTDSNDIANTAQNNNTTEVSENIHLQISKLTDLLSKELLKIDSTIAQIKSENHNNAKSKKVAS